jgi:hypothetical protein
LNSDCCRVVFFLSTHLTRSSKVMFKALLCMKFSGYMAPKCRCSDRSESGVYVYIYKFMWIHGMQIHVVAGCPNRPSLHRKKETRPARRLICVKYRPALRICEVAGVIDANVMQLSKTWICWRLDLLYIKSPLNDPGPLFGQFENMTYFWRPRISKLQVTMVPSLEPNLKR